MSYSCYLCGSESQQIGLNVEFGCPIYKCNGCGLIQTEWLTQTFLDGYYSNAFSVARQNYVSDGYLGFAQERGREQREYIERIVPDKEFQNILDYGAGVGAALQAFPNTEKYAFDPDPSMRRYLSQENGIHFVDLEALYTEAFDKKFDLILLSHVLEHFLDPVGELQKLRRCMMDTGLVFIEVPVEDEQAIALSEKTLKADTGHVFHFSEHTLSNLLSQVPGYELVDIVRCGPPIEETYLGKHPLTLGILQSEDGIWLRALLRATEASGEFESHQPQVPLENRIESLRRARQREIASVKDLRRAYDLLRPATNHQAHPIDAISLNTNYHELFLEVASQVKENLSSKEKILEEQRQLLTEERSQHASKDARIRDLELKYRDFAKERLPDFEYDQDGIINLDSLLHAFQIDGIEKTDRIREKADRIREVENELSILNKNLEERTRTLGSVKEELQNRRTRLHFAGEKIARLHEHIGRLEVKTVELNKQANDIRSSRSFRLGAFLLRPLQKVRSIIKGTTAPVSNSKMQGLKAKPQSRPVQSPQSTRGPQSQAKPIAPLNNPSSKEFYSKYGFAVFRDVLPQNECDQAAAQFRADLVPENVSSEHTTFNLAALYPPGAAYAIDDRILAPVRSCIGDDVRFLQWATYQLNYMSFPWHRDCPYREFGKGMDWDESEEPYRVAKIIAYLDCQDFALAVYPASHRLDIDRTKIPADRKKFNEIRIDDREVKTNILGSPCIVHVQKGDAIVFDQRALHCGRLIDRDSGRFTQDVSGEKSFLTYLYGADNTHSDRMYSYFTFERNFQINPMHGRLVKTLKQRNLYLSSGQVNHFDQHPEHRQHMWIPQGKSAA